MCLLDICSSIAYLTDVGSFVESFLIGCFQRLDNRRQINKLKQKLTKKHNNNIVNICCLNEFPLIHVCALFVSYIKHNQNLI